jgi:hypothetical protein
MVVARRSHTHTFVAQFFFKKRMLKNLFETPLACTVITVSLAWHGWLA